MQEEEIALTFPIKISNDTRKRRRANCFVLNWMYAERDEKLMLNLYCFSSHTPTVMGEKEIMTKDESWNLCSFTNRTAIGAEFIALYCVMSCELKLFGN